MRVGVPRETFAGERRVPLIPESVKRLASKKIEVHIEDSAGGLSFFTDEDYRLGGAQVSTASQLAATSDVIVGVRAPSAELIGMLRAGTVVVFPFQPLSEPQLMRAFQERKLTSISLDLIPRTTAAQMMDVLSSQATIAGYHAVLTAASHLPRFFPMLMTAAGTIPPARVLILGAGVAGLQAIGTARRLGAVVEAFDVRKAVKEQVESLGAKFVSVDDEADAQSAGGYAKEVSEAYKAKQSALIAERLKSADVCITTALIPGRRAPTLISGEMVRAMRRGSVIVDLASEQLGNCELTDPGRTIVADGVTIVGDLNWASRLPVHASQMFSRNVEKLLLHFSKDGEFSLNLDDEIASACVVTRDGEIVHPKVLESIQALRS